MLFPGFVLLALAAAGLRAGGRRDYRPAVLAYAVLIVTGCGLSLGPDGIRPLYAAIYRHLLGSQGIRAPARFAVLVLFGLARVGSVRLELESFSAHGPPQTP